ncbi:MAG: hypothetical protein R2825_28180 [Saprospiraceae bacterium]
MGVLAYSVQWHAGEPDGLSPLFPWGYLDIQNNGTLVNLDGLSALTSVGFDHSVQRHAGQPGRPSSAITSLGGILFIQSNGMLLANLDGLLGYIFVGRMVHTGKTAPSPTAAASTAFLKTAG